MIDAERLGRALDVMAGNNITIGYFWHDVGRPWEVLISPDSNFTPISEVLHTVREDRLATAFIGLAVPWLGDRGISMVRETGTGKVWLMPKFVSQGGVRQKVLFDTYFEACLSAVLAQGAADAE